MTDLEPNIGVCKRRWRVSQYAIEALETLLILALLLVDDAKAEHDLVRLVKV